MQNLIQLEDEVKGLPDQALQQLAQTPNAQLPQFLVVSEIQRRSDMRKRYESREGQPQGTVAQQIVNPQPQGIASMMPQQGAPQGGPMPQPPMQQPMQPPMQPPMQQLAGAPTGQPMPPQTMGMYSGGIVSMAEGRKATFPMSEVPQQSSIIGQRINNPFNIRQANQGFVGESGEESGFVSFDDPMYGVRAADRVLSTYGRDYGINSIRGLLNRYAPPEDDNDTESYISYVSNKLGVDPDAEIDLSNPEIRSQVLSPIAMFESRSEYSPGQITEMIASANEKQGDSGQSQFSMPTPNVDVSAQPPVGLASELPEFQPRQMRKGVVTTESIPQELDPLSDEFIQNQIQKDLMDSAKRSAQRDTDKVEEQNPQTPSELMAAIFGNRSTPELEKNAASERLLQMADTVKVDPKGLITTSNQPNNAIQEDAKTGASAAGPMGEEVVADVVQELSMRRDGSAMSGVAADMKQAIENNTYMQREGSGMGGVGADMKRILAERDQETEVRSGPFRGVRKSQNEIDEIKRQQAEAIEKFEGNQAEGSYAEERQSELSENVGVVVAEIQKKQAELQAYKDEKDTSNPRVIKEIKKREAEIDALSRTLSRASPQAGGAKLKEQAETEEKVDEASNAATDQAAAFLAQAKAQREAGLITKEDLAKKEALGAALIQLGAGIAGGDLAGGLSKAGIAAQDVRDKSRDRALRARYYDSVATNRSSASQTLEQKRIIDNVDAGMASYMLNDKPVYSGSPEYQAERARRILEQGAKLGIDMSSYTSSAMPIDPTSSAAAAAVPQVGASAYTIREI
jgi:hypothetical protein